MHEAAQGGPFFSHTPGRLERFQLIRGLIWHSTAHVPDLALHVLRAQLSPTPPTAFCNSLTGPLDHLQVHHQSPVVATRLPSSCPVTSEPLTPQTLRRPTPCPPSPSRPLHHSPRPHPPLLHSAGGHHPPPQDAISDAGRTALTLHTRTPPTTIRSLVVVTRCMCMKRVRSLSGFAVAAT